MIRALAPALLLVLASTSVSAHRDPTLIGRLEKLAAAGNGQALYFLGMSYQTGSGVALDHRKALTFFERAAAAGDPLAHYKLGCFYAGQDGVLPPDEDKALAHKLVAAKAGYALAQGDVAAIYAGRGMTEEALRWIAKAAAQGTSDALFGCASLHNGKNGIARDGAVVVAYFTLFLRHRDANAEQRAWLASQRAALTPVERARADRIVSSYHAAPTELTIIALSGERAAEALVARAR